MKKIVALVLSLVMVLGLATTAMAVEFDTWDAYDIYKANFAQDNFVEETDMMKVAANKNSDGAGEIAHWVDTDGTEYVEIKKADATVLDYYITAAGKDTVITYLRAVEETEYDYTVKEFKNTAVGYGKCDQIVVPYGDTSKFYSCTVPSTKVTHYFTNNDEFVPAQGEIAADATYVKFGDDVVAVYELTGVTVQHQYMVNGYDAKGVANAAKCYICDGTAKVYTDLADVKAFTLYLPAELDGGMFTIDADGDYFLVPGAVSAPAGEAGSDAAGDKVESAETFDAGIAMYVGMSVMAAAGSAVVLKKKD